MDTTWGDAFEELTLWRIYPSDRQMDVGDAWSENLKWIRCPCFQVFKRYAFHERRTMGDLSRMKEICDRKREEHENPIYTITLAGIRQKSILFMHLGEIKGHKGKPEKVDRLRRERCYIEAFPLRAQIEHTCGTDRSE